MKALKALGGVLCFIGCLVALAGILATAAPMIDNEQVRRILESFSVIGTDRLINGVNAVILFCLHQNYPLFGAGVGLLLVGGLMRTGADKALYQASVSKNETPVQAHRQETANRTVRSARTSRVERGAQMAPAAAAPKPMEAAKASEGLSPYAAAEYGRALNRNADTRIVSGIAEKYMPKSIIDTPTADEAESAQEIFRDKDAAVQTIAPETLSAGEAAYRGQTTAEETDPADELSPKYAWVERTLLETAQTEMRRCPGCGIASPADAAFCSHCGQSMQNAALVLPITANDPSAGEARALPQEYDSNPPQAYGFTAPTANENLGGQAYGSGMPEAPSRGTGYAAAREPAKRRPRIVSTLTTESLSTEPLPTPPTYAAEEANAANAGLTPGASGQPTANAMPAEWRQTDKKPRIVSTMGRKRES